MKQNPKKPTTTQEIDLSFHGSDGQRHYHEVKADPDTIVSKIGGDEAKSALTPDLDGPLSDELKKTPDQVLSYASARDHHELNALSSAERYPDGKSIVLMYVSPNTRNWLRIFTTKAGRRLLDHEFDSRLGAITFNATQLAQVQARVDLLAPAPADERNRWAILNSGAATSPYYDPANFLATLKPRRRRPRGRQRRSRRPPGSNSRPNSVNAYSTVGGVVGITAREDDAVLGEPLQARREDLPADAVDVAGAR